MPRDLEDRVKDLEDELQRAQRTIADLERALKDTRKSTQAAVDGLLTDVFRIYENVKVPNVRVNYAKKYRI